MSTALQDRAIARFWQFWKGAQRAIARAIQGGGLSDEQVAAISEHVSAIDPSLDWELGPGLASEHHLCVTGKGHADLVPIARRWLAAAPRRTKTWEFHAARQPCPPGERDLVLGIGGHDVPLEAVVAQPTLDRKRELFHVRVFHPAFPAVEEGLRTQIAFIALDNALGEDLVERWLGAIETVEQRPPRALTLGALLRRVRKLAASARGERWAVLQGEREGLPIFVTCNRALKGASYPALDAHLEVTIRLADRSRDDGLTTREEGAALDALQDQLLRRLGARAVLIGRETWKHRRVIHLHATRRVRTALDPWLRRHRGRGISVKVTPDPTWQALRLWE